jgi:hypothetical protein
MRSDQRQDGEDLGLEPEPKESFSVIRPFPITHLPPDGELARAPLPDEYSTIIASPREALVA